MTNKRSIGSLAVGGDAADELAEILGLAEIAVDRGEADVRNLIEDRQRLHNLLADLFAAELRLARAFELAHQRIDHALDPLGLDRPLAQGDIDRASQLLPVERLALVVLFQHGQFAQLHPLEGGEARRAIAAEPASPNRAAIVGRPRILYLRVIRTAERTPHPVLRLIVPPHKRV